MIPDYSYWKRVLKDDSVRIFASSVFYLYFYWSENDYVGVLESEFVGSTYAKMSYFSRLSFISTEHSSSFNFSSVFDSILVISF